MSNLLAECCCDDSPVCCDCSLATAYSVAASFSWTAETLDSTSSNVIDASSSVSFSGLTCTEPTTPCSTGSHITSSFAVRTYSPSASMTTASLAIDFDGNCTDESGTNVAGATSVSGLSAAALTRAGLACYHEIDASSSLDIHFWVLNLGFDSTATCSDSQNEWEFTLLVYSTPQSSCHAPPSSGWNLLAPGSGTTAADSNLIASISNGAQLRTCNTGPITCRTFSPRNSSATNQSLTVTVT
jgi:hypothetical protein